MSTRTFRDIETELGVVCDYAPGESPLSDWYLRMRDIPLAEFGGEDLARCIRQNQYLGDTVPFAVAALEKDPWAGDMYDGELLMAFRFVPDSFWLENPLHAKAMAKILEGVRGDLLDSLTDDQKPDALALLAKLRDFAGLP